MHASTARPAQTITMNNIIPRAVASGMGSVVSGEVKGAALAVLTLIVPRDLVL